jgi:hypothetical protein
VQAAAAAAREGWEPVQRTPCPRSTPSCEITPYKLALEISATCRWVLHSPISHTELVYGVCGMGSGGVHDSEERIHPRAASNGFGRVPIARSASDRFRSESNIYRRRCVRVPTISVRNLCHSKKKFPLNSYLFFFFCKSIYLTITRVIVFRV